MNSDTVYNYEWSAKKLGFVASIFACTVSAILALIVMKNFSFSGVTWTILDKVFVVFISYTQLFASTLHHSPVRRHGNVIEGMIFSDLGDDNIQTTVGQWIWHWFVSVLCHSAVISAIGILIIYTLSCKSCP
ncbi:MAG: hypothetical protein G01um101444_177 [Parcubacteria group bacterium Gr01-1014_44]|nr:MAG: hypothetical protein G01um101444_177 [Parcubacteria group bacterium Gr01-1014_44]